MTEYRLSKGYKWGTHAGKFSKKNMQASFEKNIHNYLYVYKHTTKFSQKPCTLTMTSNFSDSKFLPVL